MTDRGLSFSALTPFSASAFQVQDAPTFCLLSVVVSKITTVVSRQVSRLRFLGSTPFSITLLLVLAIIAVLAALLGKSATESIGFLLLVLALFVSSVVALQKKWASIVSEMRDWRENVKHKSLLHSRYNVQWQAVGSSDLILGGAARTLKQHGYQTRVNREKKRALISARAGLWSRVGFLLCHFAIVILCLAALLNSGLISRFFSPESDQPSSRQSSAYKNYVESKVVLPTRAEQLDFKVWSLRSEALAEENLLGRTDGFEFEASSDSAQGVIEYSGFRWLDSEQAPLTTALEQRSGAAVVFWQKKAADQTIEFISYLEPVDKDGIQVFVSGSRPNSQSDFKFVYFPADARVSSDRFITFLHKLQRNDLVVAYAREVVDEQRSLAQGDPRLQMVESMGDLLELFLQQGFNGVDKDIADKVPAAQQSSVRALTNRLLQTVMLYAYQDILLEEGKETLDDFDERWLKQAVQSLEGLYQYGSPLYLQLQGVEPVASQDGQLARIVSLTCLVLGLAMLLIGLAMQHFLRPRRLWVSLCLDSQQLIFAGFESQEKNSFSEEFDVMAAELKQRSFPVEHSKAK